MALNLEPGIFANIIEDIGRELIIRDYIFLRTETFKPPSEKVKRDAKKFAQNLIDEGKLEDYLEATAPKPCPTCGHIP